MSLRSSPRALGAAIVLSAIVFVGCINIEVDGESINDDNGSGTLATEDRAVAAFSALEVSGALRAELRAGLTASKSSSTTT